MVPVAAVVKEVVTPLQTDTEEGCVVMLITGPAVTVKLLELVAVFPATVTVIGPVVAPVGTEVVIEVAVLAVTTAVVPLNWSVLLAGVVLKFVPIMLTVVPTKPDVGVKEVIVGKVAAPTVKLVAD